jgi:hypothetical protein
MQQSVVYENAAKCNKVWLAFRVAAIYASSDVLLHLVM